MIYLIQCLIVIFLFHQNLYSNQIKKETTISQIYIYYTNSAWSLPSPLVKEESVKNTLKNYCSNNMNRTYFSMTNSINHYLEKIKFFVHIDKAIRRLDTAQTYDSLSEKFVFSKLICLIERDDKSVDTIAMGNESYMQFNSRIYKLDIELLREVSKYLPTKNNDAKKSIEGIITKEQ